MGAVDLHAVEADALGVGGGPGERADHVVQVLLGHRLARGLGTRGDQAGGADGRGVREGGVALVADHADVPQLRHDRAARRVYVLGDLRPARELLLAVEPRHAVALPGRLVADVRPLGDDEPDPGGGTAGVVGAHVLAGNAARREHTGHRRHHDPVRNRETVERDRAGQYLGRAGGGRRDGHVRGSS